MGRGSVSIITENTAATAENQLLLLSISDQSVEELFDPPQLFLEGETIQIQEVLDLRFVVENPLAVDVDQGWFGRKVYVGTYRLDVDSRIESATDGDEGFITALNFKIKRTSTYTVRHPRGQSQYPIGSSKLDACNFALVGGSIAVPLILGQASRIQPENPEAVFTGENYNTLAPLDPALPFFPKLASVGVNIRPGVRLLQTEYTRRVINSVLTLRPPRGEVPVCALLNSCDTEFSAFIQSRNDGLDLGLDGQDAYYRTRREAVQWATVTAPSLVPDATPEEIAISNAFLLSILRSENFQCPDGSTRTYWLFGGVSG